MPLTRPVYLTGFMGSGKSTIGPKLATALGVAFIDLDHEIVRRAGKSIPEIFTAEGENAFRALERTVLGEIPHREPAVVSVGGGALVDAENLRSALESGTVVYLKASAKTLAARLTRGAAGRPMLRGESGETLQGDALRRRIETLLEGRRPYYERAHVIVETSDRNVADLVAEIADRVTRRDQA
ncbi:MAG TPA: shikimate kinase [Rhodothermales bacterium]